jgi:hypothetical protein
MSMNFAREQSLLRQRLQAAGNPELAALRKAEHGDAATFLGADDAAVRAAAGDLSATHPQMGRAQMTAFVRTLWQTKIHEVRAVGIELLAARSALLEPADLAFLEGLLDGCSTDDVAARLAGDVIGVLVTKNKKLWKDLRRFATASNAVLRRAAVRACRLPLLADGEGFPRFLELAEPLATEADPVLQRAIDELLAAAAAVHADAVAAFAARLGRKVVIPKKKKDAAERGPVVAAKAPITKAPIAKTALAKPAPKPAAALGKPPAKKRAAAKKA